MTSPLAALCLLLAVHAGAVTPAEHRAGARVGSVEVQLLDHGRATRAEPVARWLADDLAAVMPAPGPWHLAVERRAMPVLVAVEGDTLLLHPRLPAASLDERLQVVRAAAWLLLRPGLGESAAWARAGEVVAPLRPDPRGPSWWPHCCTGLDAQAPPPSFADVERSPVYGDDPAVSPPGTPGRRPFGRADIYGAFRSPLGGDWPWVVGGAALYAPIDRWEIVAGVEAMPLGLVETRLGVGLVRWEQRILRLDGGVLLAGNLGAVLPEGQQQDSLRYPEGVEAGVWADTEWGGWRSMVRLLPEERLGVDAWLGWERRFALADRWYILPFTRARWVSPWLYERQLSTGGSWGVRWMPADALITDRTLTARAEVEHVIPTGRIPGPAWVRPRAVLLRVGADTVWSVDTGLQAGWAGSVGLAMNPVREIKGIAWVIFATPPDFSSLSWFVWFGTWMPRP
ncbi:MAG: hypothetical protein ABIO70_20595 [Pseudomonadota bacterium]